MGKIYIAKNVIEKEGRDKPDWEDVGLKVFIKDNGKVSIYDARTNTWYPCVEPKSNTARTESGDARQAQSGSAGSSGSADFNDMPY